MKRNIGKIKSTKQHKVLHQKLRQIFQRQKHYGNWDQTSDTLIYSYNRGDLQIEQLPKLRGGHKI